VVGRRQGRLADASIGAPERPNSVGKRFLDGIEWRRCRALNGPTSSDGDNVASSQGSRRRCNLQRSPFLLGPWYDRTRIKLGPFIVQLRTSFDCIGKSVSCHSTKSLRSSPLRGSKSREAGSWSREDSDRVVARSTRSTSAYCWRATGDQNSKKTCGPSP
jgi:hypothetical protein